METIKSKLTSRKLWVTVIGVVFFILKHDYNAAQNLIMVYVGAQAVTDIGTAVKTK